MCNKWISNKGHIDADLFKLIKSSVEFPRSCVLCFDLTEREINVTRYTLVIICCCTRYSLVDDFEATL